MLVSSHTYWFGSSHIIAMHHREVCGWNVAKHRGWVGNQNNNIQVAPRDMLITPLIQGHIPLISKPDDVYQDWPLPSHPALEQDVRRVTQRMTG